MSTTPWTYRRDASEAPVNHRVGCETDVSVHMTSSRHSRTWDPTNDVLGIALAPGSGHLKGLHKTTEADCGVLSIKACVKTLQSFCMWWGQICLSSPIGKLLWNLQGRQSEDKKRQVRCFFVVPALLSYESASESSETFCTLSLQFVFFPQIRNLFQARGATRTKDGSLMLSGSTWKSPIGAQSVQKRASAARSV